MAIQVSDFFVQDVPLDDDKVGIAELMDVILRKGIPSGWETIGYYDERNRYYYGHWTLVYTDHPQHGGVVSLELYHHGIQVIASDLI